MALQTGFHGRHISREIIHQGILTLLLCYVAQRHHIKTKALPMFPGSSITEQLFLLEVVREAILKILPAKWTV